VVGTNSPIYDFGSWNYDPTTHFLKGPKHTKALRRQVAALLERFLNSPNEPLSRTELAAGLWNDPSDKKDDHPKDDLSRVLSDLRMAFRACGISPPINRNEEAGKYQLDLVLTPPALRTGGPMRKLPRTPDHLCLAKPGDEIRLESCSEIIVCCWQAIESDSPERVLNNMAAGIRHRFVFSIEDLPALGNLLCALATGSKHFDNQGDQAEVIATNLDRLKKHLQIIVVEDRPWYEYLVAINSEHHVRAAVYLRRPGTDDCFLYSTGSSAQGVVKCLERSWSMAAKSRQTYGFIQASAPAAEVLKQHLKRVFQSDFVAKEIGLIPPERKPAGKHPQKEQSKAALA